MKYCGKCGQEIHDEAVVCVHCGASQGEEAPKPAEKAGSLSVLQLVWSIINIVFGSACLGIPSLLGIIALVMTIIAATAKTIEDVAKYTKIAKILNLVATIIIIAAVCLSVIGSILYFVLVFFLMFVPVM